MKNIIRGLVVPLAVASLSVACASTQPASEQVSDSAITAKIEAKLAADPEVNPFEIDVDTNEGVVRLSGKVEEASDREEAEALARDTKGVRRVVNEIELGDPTLGEKVTDAAITTKVKAKLAADPIVNPFNVGVDTKDGIVTLSGRVAKESAKAEAEKHARNTQGVREVHNRVEVGPEQ